MTENEFGVIRLDNGVRFGELLYIGNSRQECYKAVKDFKNDGTCQKCKVMSYEQIVDFERRMARRYEHNLNKRHDYDPD